MMEKKKRITKYIISEIIIMMPFIIGVWGFLQAGANISQACYNSLSLYFFKYYHHGSNIFVELAKWTAPVAAISGIFTILKNMAVRVVDFFRGWLGSATVIYCEDEDAQILRQNIEGSVIGNRRNVFSNAKDNIIMFQDDMEALNFYYQNEKRFEDSNVYIRLSQMDSSIMKENKVSFFNETELIARKYWKDRNLLKYLDKDCIKVKIAIIGFEELGQKLLSFGIMNNIYAKEQYIEYHIWGDSVAYEQVFSQIDLMNGDNIIYHGKDWAKDLTQLSEFDRIIVAKENNLDLIESLLYVCRDADIDYYNKGDALLEDIYSSDKLNSFGSQRSILTQQNIMKEDVYRQGMELNYAYHNAHNEVGENSDNKEQKMKELWSKLDGFVKSSNMASADYHEIRLMILKHQGKVSCDFTEEEQEWLSKAEHIRWSRFHFMNHWIYKPLENGMVKDSVRRIHTSLVPYEELTREVQLLDWETICKLMSLKNLES